MKKIMLVFGTRPEAVKLGPLISELRRRRAGTVVCVTGQHRRLLDQALAVFDIAPDYDLNILREGQTPASVTMAVLEKLPPILARERPDIVLVHGDTSTAFAASLACYYAGVPVGHVEAGLRTFDPFAPYPEEFNRRAADIVSRFCFAPTEHCRQNLLREGVPTENVFVTGNTIVDALRTTLDMPCRHPALDWAEDSRLILVTAHRRENLGEPMRHMFRAIRRVAREHPDVKILYPVHPNPLVREPAMEELSGQERVRLIAPVDAVELHHLLQASYFVLTDSGGLQEEGAVLHRPVLVMRRVTERPEGVESGALRLAGTDEETIFALCHELITDPAAYRRMTEAENPYGDGRASERIADILLAAL